MSASWLRATRPPSREYVRLNGAPLAELATAEVIDVKSAGGVLLSDDQTEALRRFGPLIDLLIEFGHALTHPVELS